MGEVERNGDGQELEERLENDKLVERAHRLERDIINAAGQIRTWWIGLGALFHRFKEERAWELLGYESFQEFLAMPELGFSQAHIDRLVRIYRELVVERSVPVGELKGVDIEKVRLVLPAIRAGERSWQDAISDCRSLPRGDVEAKYADKRGPDAPIDPEEEPEKRPCPTCGSWVEAEKIEEKAA